MHDILSHQNQLQNKTIFDGGLIDRLARSLVNAASKLTNHGTGTFPLQPDRAPCHQVSACTASKTANWEEGHMHASQRANDRQSTLITSISLESVALIYEHATQSCMWHTHDILLAIGSLKKANCKPCSLSSPRHSRRTAVGSSSLMETCRIMDGFFDYKGGESSLMMHSSISTIFYYSTTGLLNKSTQPLSLLLKHTTSPYRSLLL